jgi:hypothetical protein
VLLDGDKVNDIIVPLYDYPMLQLVFARDHVRTNEEQRQFRRSSLIFLHQIFHAVGKHCACDFHGVAKFSQLRQ